MNPIDTLQILPSVEGPIEIDRVVALVMQAYPFAHCRGVGQQNLAGRIPAKTRYLTFPADPAPGIVRGHSPMNQGWLVCGKLLLKQLEIANETRPHEGLATRLCIQSNQAPKLSEFRRDLILVVVRK